MIKMKLNDKSFNLIEGGHKKIEVRLNDEKRSLLKINNTIKFINTKTAKSIKVLIIDLFKYKNFKELIYSNKISDLGYRNQDDLLYDLEKYYSKEREEKHGVVAIKIKLLK